MKSAPLAMLTIVIAAQPITAQLSVTATGSMTASHSAANIPAGQQSLPNGSVLTAGTSITSGAASTRYLVNNTGNGITVALTSASPGMSASNPLNWWSQTAASGNASVTLSSAVPLDVDVVVRISRASFHTCQSIESSVSAGAIGSWSTQSNCAVDPSNPFTFLPCDFQFSTTIDAAGLSIALQTSASGAYSFTSQCGVVGAPTGTASLTITPRSSGTEYGPQCGMSLTSEGDLQRPGIETLVISAPNALPIGVLIVGTGQIAVPMPWGCDLLTNPVVSVGLNLNASGEGRLSVPRPPLGIFTLQAGTFDLVTANMSNGLSL